MDKTIKYEVISVKNTKRDMSEKTFCFACGCFQGGGGGGVNNPEKL